MSFLPDIRGFYVTWNAYPNAEAYSFAVWENNRSGAGVLWWKIFGTNITVTQLKDCFTYYYEVVALPAGVIIDSGYIQTVTPASTLNASVKSDGSVNFTWNKGCGSYLLEQWLDIDDNSNFSSILLAIPLGLTTQSSLVAAGMIPAGKYYWRINKRHAYKWFPSTTGMFTISPVADRYPATGLSPDQITLTSTEITLTWTPGSGPGMAGQQVDVKVSGVSWRDATSFTGLSNSARSQKITGLTAGVTYIWRVLTNFNNPSDILTSREASFTAGSPSVVRHVATNLQPKDITLVYTSGLDLTWTPGSGDGYAGQQLDLAVYPDWAGGQHIALSPTQNKYHVTGLVPIGYMWRILSSFNNPSEVLISDVATFIIAPPELVPATLILPANGAVGLPVGSVDLKWNLGSGAPIDSQLLNITIYPSAWDAGLQVVLGSSDVKHTISGLLPGVGYVWKITTFFKTVDGIVFRESKIFAFYTQSITRYPAKDLKCSSPAS